LATVLLIVVAPGIEVFVQADDCKKPPSMVTKLLKNKALSML
jgi:hypothetical protein